MNPQIYLDDANISPIQWDRVRDLMLTNDPSTRSSLVSKFEQTIAADVYASSDCVIATNSGTSALHLALLTIPEWFTRDSTGADVHLPALTFVAPVNAARYIDANIIFHDVDPNTWVLGGFCGTYVLPVALYGVLPYVDDYMVILDACGALGTEVVGAKADFVAYSFNGNKTITCGAGGLLVGKDLDKMQTLRGIASQAGLGQNLTGVNYRMPGLNAALGLVQLQYLPRFLARKREIHAEYCHELGDIIKFQIAPPNTNPSWWMTAGTFPEEVEIPTLQMMLLERGIPTRRVFRPFGTREEFPTAWGIYDHGLCLPSSTRNTIGGILWVCEQVKEALDV